MRERERERERKEGRKEGKKERRKEGRRKEGIKRKSWHAFSILPCNFSLLEWECLSYAYPIIVF
jgi:hypothetical protein